MRPQWSSCRYGSDRGRGWDAVSAWGSQESLGTSKWGFELELKGKTLGGLCVCVGHREKVWQPDWKGTACQVQGSEPHWGHPPVDPLDPPVPISMTLGTQVPS